MIEVTNSLLFPDHGKFHPELHKAIMAVHPDMTTVGIYDGLGNGKTEAIVPVLSVADRVYTVEPLKKLLLLLRQNRLSPVYHR